MIPAEEIEDFSDVPEEDRRAEIYDKPEFEAVHDLAHKRLSPEEAAEEESCWLCVSWRVSGCCRLSLHSGPAIRQGGCTAESAKSWRSFWTMW